MDALDLSQQLIRCPSITPTEGGALQLLEKWLEELGFSCNRVDFADVPNLHARLGTEGPHLAFAGHTDVVPLGDESAWSIPPFDAKIEDNKLWGRGSEDMKCAIACFISSLSDFLSETPYPSGSISLIITGDEEGPAINGTQKMLDWMQSHNHIPDLCLIGEPTSVLAPGDRIKVGRRGSLTAKLTVGGKQGHIAYPHLADNPIPRLLKTLQRLSAIELDKGTEHFEPSQLVITSIDVGNPTTNVIPNQASARFGIRFNTLHKSDSLAQQVRQMVAAHAGNHELEIHLHGDAFHNQDSKGIELVSEAIRSITGKRPELCTRGGTSDGRFIIHHCPVLELGMAEHTMHQIDEHVPLPHIEDLTNIYKKILKDFFKPVVGQ